MKYFGILLCFLLVAMETGVWAGTVSCYNDDSQDIINQDELRMPPYPGGPARIPDPNDCSAGPTVVIDDQDGFQSRVLVNGTVVYDNGFEPVIEARVAPSGAVALLTRRGSLFLYKEGRLSSWFEAGVHALREFRLARGGELLAVTTDGQLVADGRVISRLALVRSLLASASGHVVALMDDGTVVDARGSLYSNTIDPVIAVKVAARGTVVVLTKEGRMFAGTSSHLLRMVYGETTDPALAFKVSTEGHVAYLTAEGRLRRDGMRLSSPVERIVSFKIYTGGVVTALDSEGRAHSYSVSEP